MATTQPTPQAFPTTDDLTFLPIETARSVLTTLRHLRDMTVCTVHQEATTADESGVSPTPQWYVYMTLSRQTFTLSAWALKLLRDAGQLREGGAA